MVLVTGSRATMCKKHVARMTDKRVQERRWMKIWKDDDNDYDYAHDHDSDSDGGPTKIKEGRKARRSEAKRMVLISLPAYSLYLETDIGTYIHPL